MLFVGDDWAEDHHDVWLMDGDGHRLGGGRLPEGLEGIGRFHELVGGHVSDPSEVMIGIETDRGLWVEALVASGYQVFALNPRSVARYRERHVLSGAKSDTADAKVLADAVRTDRHNHRRVAGDTAEVEAVKTLTRAHQNLIWDRTRHVNRLRSTLREFFPAAVATFEDLASRDAVAVLTRAPDPAQAAKLTVAQIQAALRKGGRRRNIEPRAAVIKDRLAVTELRALIPVEETLAMVTRSTLAVIDQLNIQIGLLETELAARFRQHPDADIYLSLPGLADVLGARALGEFGDDPDRYATAKSRRNYAGSSPITIASGRHRVVKARHVKNNRLHDTLFRWAFCAITASPGARAFYDQQRTKGASHNQALRTLANRLVGILHGCLQNHTPYNEHTAWGHRQPAIAA
jgi:transposase